MDEIEQVEKLIELVKSLEDFRQEYTDDEYIPVEINRLILIVKGRIYDLNLVLDPEQKT